MAEDIKEFTRQPLAAYAEYPRTKFPEEIDDWDNMEDLDATTAPLAEEYNNLFQSGQYSAAAEYLDEHPELDLTLFNAYKFNQLMDGIKAVERLFIEDLNDYIYELFNHTIGIDDEVDLNSEEELHTNTFSAYKILELVGGSYLGVVTTLDLTTSGWSSSSPYTQTFTVDGITSDTVLCPGIIYPDNCTRDQQKAINKAAGYVCSIETGTNKITVTATQKPTTDFTLGCVGNRETVN